MKGGLRYFLFSTAGIILSVLPPVAAILVYFPLWLGKGGKEVLSGLSLLLLLVAVIPLFRVIKKIFESPSAPVIWLTVFIIFFMLRSIANEITVISFIGFVGNAVGALMFKLAKGGESDAGEK